jgi:phosphoglycolate phosphatase-like HAD superfamily hydrolase
MIGDTWKDIVAGNKSQLKTILIGNDYEYPYQYKDIKPDFIVNDIIDAVKAIEGAK